MKRNHPLAAVALAALAASAPAQRRGRDFTPEERARGQAHVQLMHEIHEAEKRAHAFLVQGEKDKALAEADRALRRLDGQSPTDAMTVHELLAEIFVEQGRYATALEELKQTSKDDTAARLATTKALALVGVGRAEEALPLLTQALKDANMVVRLLGNRDDLPASRDASKAALAATAYLLRAIDDYSTRSMDYEAALRLAPRNPVVALNAARFYREKAKRPDLARKALAQASGGGEATRVLLKKEADALAWETPSGG